MVKNGDDNHYRANNKKDEEAEVMACAAFDRQPKGKWRWLY